ncbi:hypothetical protein A3B19_02500 [Candidatus Giovannonibacteria bacterium RIFCSPLOWO2_01_FULL_46_32]|uniref:Uncharacterized protein n=1 Tax=Candidatus Giovannonibacteria bacterium RIFCSPLOWO2_01_FULL_46_32 TaxID=1798353 RepID=A0A1F5XJK3_9BACT|nr:MAG: hypothetical protein A3B19_02500 [Candidatus Giovannonibacteria bacterium RIFCSPLOWO2_01_FULL_46_32]
MRITRWFVEPLDCGFTNEVIARYIPGENYQQAGEKHLWECPYAFIEQLKASRSSWGVKFKIFKQEGGGKIREFDERIFSKKRVLARKINERVAQRHLCRS